jgi:hypothetical protein
MDVVARYRGRDFTRREIEWLEHTMDSRPGISRRALSIAFCEQFEWRNNRGRTKDMACRDAMLRLQEDGLVVLPAPKVKWSPKQTDAVSRTSRTDAPAKPPEVNLKTLELAVVRDPEQSRLWREYVARYHYLGMPALRGAQLRYFVKSADENIALIGFASAVWKCRARDDFIGWSARQRVRGLQRIVNNARFLVFPWVQCFNLGSRILSLALRRVWADWSQEYGIEPVLAETFVEEPRFSGGVYRAANWTMVGRTAGRGRRDVHKTASLTKKSVWLYPLRRHIRRILCCDS